MAYTDSDNNIHIHSLTPDEEIHQHFDDQGNLTGYSSVEKADLETFVDFVDSQKTAYGGGEIVVLKTR